MAQCLFVSLGLQRGAAAAPLNMPLSNCSCLLVLQVLYCLLLSCHKRAGRNALSCCFGSSHVRYLTVALDVIPPSTPPLPPAAFG